MSITKPILLNETGQEIVNELREQNVLLNVMARKGLPETLTLRDILSIVRSGAAPKVFNPGDRIIVPWKDKSNSPATEYDAQIDVLGFGNVDTLHEEGIPGMFIGWHWAIPFSAQFDAREAFYVVPSGGLPAGTYHFNSIAWSKITAGNYQFTTTQAHIEGQQFMFRAEYVGIDGGFVGGFIDVYENATSTTVVASYEISSGNGGTKLGDLTAAGNANLNSIQRAMYGYNKHSHSSMRQFLNSDKAAGAWWIPQNPYDRPPTELATKHGFVSGFEPEFLEIIQPVKIRTALNTVVDDGSLEETYDTFFLPSLSQMHVKHQLDGEGEAFDYWKKVSQSKTPLEWHPNVYPQMRIFGIENKNSAQHVWLRSANRGCASDSWSEHPPGSFYSNAARGSRRVAPVCVIC